MPTVSDRVKYPFTERVQWVVCYTDISLLVFLGGCGELLLTTYAIFNLDALERYAQLFRIGGIQVWLSVNVAATVGMLVLPLSGMPPRPTFFMGGFILVVWGWAAIKRISAIYTEGGMHYEGYLASNHTGAVTAVILATIGLLMMHRTRSRL